FGGHAMSTIERPRARDRVVVSADALRTSTAALRGELAMARRLAGHRDVTTIVTSFGEFADRHPEIQKVIRFAEANAASYRKCRIDPAKLVRTARLAAAANPAGFKASQLIG